MNRNKSEAAPKKQRYILEQMDPLSKLIILFCVAALAMQWDNPAMEAGLLLISILLGHYAGGIAWGSLTSRLTYMFWFAIPLFVLTLMASKGDTILVQWGFFTLTKEAILSAGGITLRLLVLFTSSIVYMLTTKPQEFVYMLTTKLKVPYRIAFAISLALTFLPLLEAEGRSAAAAKRIRMGRAPRGGIERISLALNLAASVFIAAIRRVQHTARAMDAKGFGAYPERTYLRTARYSNIGFGIACTVMALTAYLWFN